MLSFGFSVFVLVVVIVIIVVGPKEIPALLRQLGAISKSLKKASRQFKSSLNDLAEENDLKEIKNSISNISEIKNNLDPTKEIKKEISSIKETLTFTDKEIKDINKKVLKDNE